MDAAVTDLVIFGGLGDLSRRKLLPALFNALLLGDISVDSRIILIGREQLTDEEFHARVAVSMKEHGGDAAIDAGALERFQKILRHVHLDTTVSDADWGDLSDLLDGRGEIVRLFYLALPPNLFDITCQRLSEHELISPASRLIIEKPIGHDRESARDIGDTVARYFSEDQIYRIDHYLGKETVQNLLVLRFANALFERMWGNQGIDHVQITVAETVGLEGRAGFYDQSGAMRDMVQNHVLQLLALICMEPPNAMNAEAVRQEKVKVLRALRPIAGRDVATHTLRGQYGPGVSSGKPVGGYTDDLGGPSDTETFVAIRAHVDNWRWAGVPFYLRTGKRLTERYAEIVIQFSSVPLDVYGAGPQTLEPNRLVICLQPDERLSMTIMTKDSTSRATRIKPTAMSLSFIDEDDKPRQAYHRLILDAIDGDQSLFAHKDEVDAAWAWIDPIIEGWQEFGTSPEAYESGSWGPREADFLLARDDRTWRAPFCSADSEPS